MELREYERLDPCIAVDSPAGPVYFSTPNEATAWRAQTLFTKEPDTIQWIEGFEADAVLVDIGANVGMYAIWAARTRAVRVFAFEPESQNYALLNRNILRNGLDRLVLAYCASLSDEPGFGRLNLSNFLAGGSVHQYERNGQEQGRQGGYSQGSFSTTLDILVADGVIPVPRYVKIDVDGIEPRIVRGARETFADRRVESVLIEVDTNHDSHWEMVDLMLSLGFDYSQEQVEQAQRKDGPFKGVGNYVFRR